MRIAECPVCGSSTFAPAVALSSIAEEIRFRDDFVHARIGYKASPTELKDLTDFMHGFAAPLISCIGCGLVMRAESQVRAADNYEEDPNDPDLMMQVYPRFVEAFRNKEAAYRDLLPERADILELGSHLGGFMQAAEEWNWYPIALDIGRATSTFARRRGFEVRREVIEDTALRASTFKAVFIWNCFDQLPDPAATLQHSWRLLKHHGLLVLRVPNVLFYRVLGRQFWHGARDRFIVRALAYNNLLGFPYLYGYDAEALKSLVERHGFKYLRGFNSELLTMPFADLTRRIDSEQKSISAAVADWSTRTTVESGTLTGPWIEMLFRKVEDPVRTRSRLPRRRIDTRFLERAA
jgi:SAM-dependent methyltransferase